MFYNYIILLKVLLQISCRPPLCTGMCDWISPEPSLLHAEQTHLSQPFCKTDALQPSGHLPVPPVDSLHQVHLPLFSLSVGCPRAGHSPPRGLRKAEENSLPHPADHTFFDATQEAVGFLA